MAEKIDEKFVQQVNQNLGIAHKVCKIYFHDQEDQEDVIQEMMYQLWKSYSNFDHRSKFSTWMYKVCLNTALVWRRKNKGANNVLLSSQHLKIPEQKTEDKEENIGQLFKAIGLLSPLNKAIVLLYLEDLSYEEIATITGLTKTNVSVKLVRIKKELENQLKRLNAIENVNFR